MGLSHTCALRRAKKAVLNQDWNVSGPNTLGPPEERPPAAPHQRTPTTQNPKPKTQNPKPKIQNPKSKPKIQNLKQGSCGESCGGSCGGVCELWGAAGEVWGSCGLAVGEKFESCGESCGGSLALLGSFGSCGTQDTQNPTKIQNPKPRTQNKKIQNPKGPLSF